MTAQQLEYVVAVDRFRHFARAAEACGVSQPTLSALIQKLEEELDVKIFDRGSHPVRPTAIGERIIAQARTSLNEMGQIREIVASEVGCLSGRLALAVIPTVAPYIVPAFIGEYPTTYPDVQLSVAEMRNELVVSGLAEGSLDAAIMATPLHDARLLEIPLYYEKFVAYMSPSCACRDAELKASEMPEECLWVLQEGQCVLRGQKFKFCESRTANHLYEAGGIDTLVRIVDRNGGYTVIPEMHLGFLSEAQLANVRRIVAPEPVREVSLVVRGDYIKERLLNSVADTVKRIVPDSMLSDLLRRPSLRLR